MRRSTTLSAMLATALLLMPFAASSSSDQSKPGEQPMASAEDETVIGEAYAEAEAEISAIDMESREVTLLTEDGQEQTVVAPDDVDLDKLAEGDIVVFGAYQRVSVKVLPAGSAPLGAASSGAVAKAKPGETPGRTAGERLTIVSEVAAVDAAANTVTLRGADGATQTLDVKNPENQERLKTLKAGDLVQMDLVEIFAVTLESKP